MKLLLAPCPGLLLALRIYRNKRNRSLVPLNQIKPITVTVVNSVCFEHNAIQGSVQKNSASVFCANWSTLTTPRNTRPRDRTPGASWSDKIRKTACDKMS